MSESSFIFKGADGRDVFVRCWSASGMPHGILQIIHGMAEHTGRYADFAGFMNTKGFAVYASDNRGHGRTGEMNGELNHTDSDGFTGITEDQRLLSALLRDRHPGVPLFVLGHSFGSFLAQRYIMRYGGGISGVILSGSRKMSGADITAGRILSVLSLPFGSIRPNKLLDTLSFGSYNKRIKNPSRRFSWLNRDEEQVKKYEEDPFCGNVMSTGFYRAFFKGLKGLYNVRDAAGIPRKLPVLVIAGAEDPVGLYGRGVKKLCGWYRSLGMEDIRFVLYEGSRHEIIIETNREKVRRDIAEWLSEHNPGAVKESPGPGK